MKTIEIGKTGVVSSRLIYGCMRIAGDQTVEAREKGERALRAALEEGFTHFDHADIYGGGACEALFSEVLQEQPGLRERIVITSKCGILREGDPKPTDPSRYDLTAAYIKRSVEDSLNRLRIEHLDFLLLHRPDYLARMEEVAAAFRELRDAGKVLHFGVSNFKMSQVSLLQSHCSVPLAINQIEINIHNISSLQDGTLDQCQMMGMTPQAWCPIGGVAYPAWWNTLTKEEEARIKSEFDRQAAIYGVEDWVVMLAWLLKHPADIAPIIGSTTPSRIAAAKQALDMDYSREDWYRLLIARTGNSQTP